MNRVDLQKISLIRLKESQILFGENHYCGAYYLAGYSIECALKACIAKKNVNHILLKEFYTHALIDLAKSAELIEEIKTFSMLNIQLYMNWNIVKNWNERSRYLSEISKIQAIDIINAIQSQQEGVLPWIMSKW